MATLETQLANSRILNSWKEIAGYMGRGLRTVQRWEHDLALPVRRPRGKSRSAVLAIRQELDAWIASRPQTPVEDKHGVSTLQPRGQARPSLQESIQKSRVLWSEARERRRELSVALQALVKNLRQLDTQRAGAAQNGTPPTKATQES
jgi:hypothetical protein